MSDKRILVAMTEPEAIGEAPTVILGITEETWLDLEGGRAQDVDLRLIGIPATILVMRGKDHIDITRQLAEACETLKIPTDGLADLSVPKPDIN